MKYVVLMIPMFLAAYAAQSSTQMCKYEFTVPDQNCVGSSAETRQKVSLLEQNLGRSRLELVSANGLLQRNLNKLQAQTITFQQQLAALTTEVRTMKQAMGSLTPSTAPSIYELQSQINAAKNDLNRALLDLTSNLRGEAVQQSRVNSAIQEQVITQVRATNRAIEQLDENKKALDAAMVVAENLTNSFQSFANETGTTLTYLQVDIDSLGKDFKQTDAYYSQRFSTLDETLTNQSQALSNVNAASNAALARVRNTEGSVSAVHQQLGSLRTRMELPLNTVVNDMSLVKNKTLTLANQITQLGTTQLQSRGLAHTLRRDLDSLKVDLVDELLKTNQRINKLKTSTGNGF